MMDNLISLVSLQVLLWELYVWTCDFSFSDEAVSDTKVYDYAKAWGRCFKHCRYTIAKDGVHGDSKDGTDELFFKWGSPTSA